MGIITKLNRLKSQQDIQQKQRSWATFSNGRLYPTKFFPMEINAFLDLNEKGYTSTKRKDFATGCGTSCTSPGLLQVK